MADYDLYYWPMPFRGQFIRGILAYAGKSWTEHDSGDIGKLMKAQPRDQPIGFMGPPVLIDNATGFALSEMPAIALYLGERLGLIADSAEARAMTVKIVNDSNDVIDELTLDGGREMWTAKKWKAFEPRLTRWMTIWEATAEWQRVEADRGFLLGTGEPGVADIVTSILWTTMSERFAKIAMLFDETAPIIAGLSRRMQAAPSLAKLSKAAFDDYGDGYCGGEIEASLRKIAG